MWWVRLIAQTVDPSAPPANPWAQLGVYAVTCVLLSTICWLLWRENQSLHRTNDLLRDEALKREREFSELIRPPLLSAVAVLSDLPARVSEVLGQARESSKAAEVEQMIQHAVDEAVRRTQ